MNGENATVKPNWFMSDDRCKPILQQMGQLRLLSRSHRNSFVPGMLTELGELSLGAAASRPMG